MHPANLDGREFIRLAGRGAVPADLEAAAAAAAAAAAKAAAKAAAAAKKQAAKAGVPAEEAAPAAAPAAVEAPAGPGVYQHAVMNLPASAVEFLDAFNGAFDPQLWAGHPLPLVHVYTFCKGDETEAGAWGCWMDGDLLLSGIDAPCSE